MIEPTEEMIEAGMIAWQERDPENHFCIWTVDVIAMYKAMRALEPASLTTNATVVGYWPEATKASICKYE